MRIISALPLLVALLPLSVHAKGNQVEFAGVQKECVQVGKITFGPGGRWANCHVTRGRWVATIDFTDLYQAQYCLGKNEQTCDQRAMVIFANRAYKPTAKVLLTRIDKGGTEYDDPLVVSSPNGRAMVVTARTPNGADTKNYYRWQTDHWIPMNEKDGQELEQAPFLSVGKLIMLYQLARGNQ